MMRGFELRRSRRFAGRLGAIMLFSIACTPPPPVVQEPAPRTLEPEWNDDGRFNSQNYRYIHRNFEPSCWKRFPEPSKYLTREC